MSSSWFTHSRTPILAAVSSDSDRRVKGSAGKHFVTCAGKASKGSASSKARGVERGREARRGTRDAREHNKCCCKGLDTAKNEDCVIHSY